MLEKTSIQDLFDLPASVMQSVLIQPSAVSVISSSIKNLALAVIGAECNLSKRCMKKLAELIKEHDRANKIAYIERIKILTQKACSATFSNNI